MNGIAAILLVVAAVNPVRRRYELPEDRARVAAGAVIAVVVLLTLGLAGEWLLESLDITVPTFRVAVGLVLVLVAAIDLFRRLPGGGPAPDGSVAAFVPVVFPVLLRPEVALAAVAVGADAGVGWLAAGLAVAVADVVWWAERGRYPGVDRALAMALSAVAIVLAIDLLVDGVFAL